MNSNEKLKMNLQYLEKINKKEEYKICFSIVALKSKNSEL